MQQAKSDKGQSSRVEAEINTVKRFRQRRKGKRINKTEQEMFTASSISEKLKSYH